MSSTILRRNSTNVRHAIAFAWHRIALAVASTLAPERAVDRAARLFSTPPRYAHTPREVELLKTGRGFVANSGFRRLAAWRFGSREQPAIVFSHGWGGRGAQFRQFVASLNEAGYQVVLFDHEGHGYSEGTESTLIHFVRGLEAVIDKVESGGGTVAGLVGHSLGAAAIAAYLQASGRKLRSVLIAPPTSIERYSGYFARRLGIPEPIRRAMQESFERRLGKRWSEFELPHSVSRAVAPALVIHDADDADVPFASGASLARAWRGARLVRTQGLGHRGVLRDPGVVQDTLDFLNDRVVFHAPPSPGEITPFAAPAALL
jgi:pimeloyl-ACP methyl ester carboxylesterase